MDQETGSKEKAKIYDGRLFGRIMSYLAPYKGWVALALVLTAVASFLGPLRPTLVQVAIDDYIVTNDGAGLLKMVGLLFLVLIGESLFSFTNTYLTRWIGQQAIFDLRTKIFRHVERLPLHYFDRTPVGKLITRTTSDVEALNTVLSAGVITILGNLGKLFFIGYFMFLLNWKLALLATAVMPLMMYATFLFRRKVRVAYRETRLQVTRLNTFLQEHITGMKIIQGFNREAEEMRRFDSVNDDHRKVQIKTVLYFAIFWPTVDIIASLALGLMIWFGGVLAVSSTLSLGVLVAFIQYVRQFFEPIRQLSDQYNTLQGAMAASERIFDLLDTDIALKEKELTTPLGSVAGEIEFRNVWFSYDVDTPEGEEPNWVLRDISFKVAPGNAIALVGATGSGKSTIINLLMRFYEIQKGQILVDGVDIREASLDELRSNIGLVLQDVFLFSGTVEDNLTLGNESIPMEKVEAGSRLVGADQFIAQLPQKYQQEIRERGASLSHGQRQLLSFVRALIYDPRILVLDEATSSVDTETEELIQQAMAKLMEGRTTIAVAHRLSTIQNADQILVLHKGLIKERGTHQELVGMDGLYRKLYELQYKEQEVVPN